VGRKNWDKLDLVLERIEAAARDGIDIGVDAYPYLAGSCNLTQLLPAWCQEGGIEALLGRLQSPALRDRIARETEEGMSNTWDDIVVCNVRLAQARTVLGQSVRKLAVARGRPPVETALDLLGEQEGFVYIISFNNNDENLRKVMTYSRTAVITDGMVTDGTPHPRTFGTYPKFLGECVREKRWLPLEEAIVRTGALAAHRFGLRGRGVLEPGAYADVVVFDPARIGSRSDYDRPACDPDGIHHVFVNGRFAVRDGRLTGERAGIALRAASQTRNG
jgi:N-acyl-D-amino-acid deacylase